MTNYLSSQTQDVFDVALAKYGGLTGLAALLADNPSIVKIDGTIEQFRKEYLVQQDTPAAITAQPVSVVNVTGSNTEVSVNAPQTNDVTAEQYGPYTSVLSGQNESVFDVASNRYGDLAGFARILNDNPEIIQGDGTVDQFRVSYLVGARLTTSTELERITVQKTDVEKTQGTPIYISGVLQSVFDVALTEYGGIGGLALLLADNPDLVLANGNMRQFRQSHIIQKNAFINLKAKAAMLKLRPQSEGSVPGGDWITEDGQSWWTDSNQPWITE